MGVIVMEDFWMFLGKLSCWGRFVDGRNVIDWCSLHFHTITMRNYQ